MSQTKYTFGPVLLNPHRTLFRLWAPNAEGVTLELAGQAPIAMSPLPDGWYEHIAECGVGTRYRYCVGPVSVPDPASRLQDRDVHDASVVVDTASHVWHHENWRGRPWHETVIYEAHVGLLGGYAGVRARLPELAALGITAIELMPIADFPGPRNWGYDGVLPYAPDRAYGTPEELLALIDAAHGLGIQVFLDVVYNHFGPDGNYLSVYAAAFFRDDTPTPWGPALDFRQPQVRRFFAENALYWLEQYRFDGLRLDAVHAITDADWLDEMAAFVRRHLPEDRHVHLILENDDNTARHLRGHFNAQWNDDGHHALHVLLTRETHGYYRDYQAPEQCLARCLAEGFCYQGAASAHRGGRPRGEPSADLPPTAFVLFLQNHDQIGNRAYGERLTTLLRAEPPREEANPLAAAIALLLLCPQIPLIFMGEEFGATAPFLYFTSHQEALAQAVREGRRREFASSPLASERHDRQPPPDPNVRTTFNACIVEPASTATPEAHIWTAYYWRLLNLRRQIIVPGLPGARALGATVTGHDSIVARWRLGNGRELTLCVNLGTADTWLPLADPYTNAAVLFESRPQVAYQARQGQLAAGSLLALIGQAQP